VRCKQPAMPRTLAQLDALRPWQRQRQRPEAHGVARPTSQATCSGNRSGSSGWSRAGAARKRLYPEQVRGGLQQTACANRCRKVQQRFQPPNSDAGRAAHLCAGSGQAQALALALAFSKYSTLLLLLRKGKALVALRAVAPDCGAADAGVGPAEFAAAAAAAATGCSWCSQPAAASSHCHGLRNFCGGRCRGGRARG
jgi:hypothetical protein